MLPPKRLSGVAWIPIIAGLLWLWFASGLGLLGFLFSVAPGCLLLASGVSTLLYPGDRRIPQFTALGGLVGVLLALPAFVLLGAWVGLALTLASVGSFVAAGSVSVQQEPYTPDVPSPVPSVALATQVAFDDAILANIALRYPVVVMTDSARVRREVHEARGLFRDRGWLDDPSGYHPAPPPLSDAVLKPARLFGIDYERMEFDSGYEPPSEDPGRDRWLSRVANRTGYAWVLRHQGGPRPWLICLHGFQMGYPVTDFPAFHAARLHRKYGLNVLLPVLPLHGPRRSGRQSGENFISGDFLDTVHAEAQTAWDVRRLLSWIKREGPVPVGIHGLSLGGYNAALIASLEEFVCAIPGIPAVDFTRLAWRHGAPLEIRYAEHHGLVHDEVAELLTVVSPLALSPKVPHERRYLFAAAADRLVPVEQVRDLWLHWERPRIVWYQGSHVTFRFHPAVQRLLIDALRESSLIEVAATAA